MLKFLPTLHQNHETPWFPLHVAAPGAPLAKPLSPSAKSFAPASKCRWWSWKCYEISGLVKRFSNPGRADLVGRRSARGVPRLWGCPLDTQGFNQAFRIKRSRYPDCKCIFRFRTEGFFKPIPAGYSNQAFFSKYKPAKWMSTLEELTFRGSSIATTLPEIRCRRVLQGIRDSGNPYWFVNLKKGRQS
jgi:hypothetical protein